jgi:hypothetical protein
MKKTMEQVRYAGTYIEFEFQVKATTRELPEEPKFEENENCREKNLAC